MKEVQKMFEKEKCCNFLNFAELPRKVPTALKIHDVSKMTSSEQKKKKLIQPYFIYLTTSSSFILDSFTSV